MGWVTYFEAMQLPLIQCGKEALDRYKKFRNEK